jgi:hypothetical protein
MSYREAPPGSPLVIVAANIIQAFDSATGKLLWEKKTLLTGTPRIATTSDRIIIGAYTKALLIETATGRDITEVALWFGVEGAISDGEIMLLVGGRGLACFGPVGYLWGVRRQQVGNDDEYWVEDATGQRITKLDRFAGGAAAYAELGITLGRAVFQPDRRQ